jgi:hypothetical protein
MTMEVRIILVDDQGQIIKSETCEEDANEETFNQLIDFLTNEYY